MDSSTDLKPVEKPDLFSNLQKDGLRVGKSVISKAKNGNPGAICKIADAYLNKGTSQGYVKAFRLYTEIAMAPEENAIAQYRIGYIHQNGLGTPVNFKVALEWYRKAADKDQPDAQNSIGSMYYKGQGVSVNHKHALKWFCKAALQENINAMFNIGTFYESGIYVKEDKKTALEWYDKAAKKDDLDAKQKVKSLTEQGYSLEEIEVKLSPSHKEKTSSNTNVQKPTSEKEQKKGIEIQESHGGHQGNKENKKSKRKNAKKTIEKLERKLEKEEQKKVELKKRVKDLKSEGKENIKLVEKLKLENLQLLQQMDEMKKQNNQVEQVEDRFKMLEGIIAQTSAMTISLFNRMPTESSRSSHKQKKNSQNKLW